MAKEETILRFEGVSFTFGIKKPILDSASFTVRRGNKVTVMGQNGAGKSTIFSLITGENEPELGVINRVQNLSIALARQVIPRSQMTLTVREFFELAFPQKVYDIDPKIDTVLEVVNLAADKEKVISTFSGGQQARLLLAFALIQDPDLLSARRADEQSRPCRHRAPHQIS